MRPSRASTQLFRCGVTPPNHGMAAEELLPLLPGMSSSITGEEGSLPWRRQPPVGPSPLDLSVTRIRGREDLPASRCYLLLEAGHPWRGSAIIQLEKGKKKMAALLLRLHGRPARRAPPVPPSPLDLPASTPAYPLLHRHLCARQSALMETRKRDSSGMGIAMRALVVVG